MKIRSVEEIVEIVNEVGEFCNCPSAQESAEYLKDKSPEFMRGLVVGTEMAIDMYNGVPILVAALLYQRGHDAAIMQAQCLINLNLWEPKPATENVESEVEFPSHILG